MPSDLLSWDTSHKELFGRSKWHQLLHHRDHRGVVEVARQGLAPAHPAHGSATHGIEEGLHTLLIAPFRRLAVDVLHRDDALSLIHI